MKTVNCAHMRKNAIYLIIGNGRMAKHLKHYLSLLDLPFQSWTRTSNESLEPLVGAAQRVLLAIRDDALADFVKQHPLLREKVSIHFSGALNVDGLFSAHPLMTFGPEYYAREVYLSIPFITVEGEPSLRELLPEFHNPTAVIPREKKALYHAFCVMSGNFTTLLWRSVFADFTRELNLNPSLLEPFLRQVAFNTLKDSGGALTGPIARGDTATIQSNLAAIGGTAYEKVYRAFLDMRLGMVNP